GSALRAAGLRIQLRVKVNSSTSAGSCVRARLSRLPHSGVPSNGRSRGGRGEAALTGHLIRDDADGTETDR
ncbi:hypothetical protein AB0D59_50695, partial [Streptomyces sp. NPDC048417]|uniref:hypothetical protein n=1 Tax=Streptomyces sp. NPDC048417 TaxID=3155387 RepID=UPI003435984C